MVDYIIVGIIGIIFIAIVFFGIRNRIRRGKLKASGCGSGCGGCSGGCH